MRGVGRAMFAAILLLIAGLINLIYGISAVSNTHFFNGTVYAFSTLHTWGWITIIIGIIQLGAGVSLMGGGGFGRVIGIFAAAIGAFEALLAIGGQSPFWALGVFALCLWVLHGLVIFGTEDVRTR